MEPESKQIRVLHVYPRLLVGGIERMILNLAANSDHNKFSFGVLTQEEGEWDNTIREAGITIYRIPYSEGKQKYIRNLDQFFKDNHFDVVHSHTHYQMSLVNKIAKRNGVPCRIAHSHLSHSEWNPLLKLLRIPKFAFHESFATDLIGCSTEALDWLFPRITRRRPASVVPNSVECRRFGFDAKARNEIRESLGIPSDAKVVINIGRTTKQKNQDYILDIAARLNRLSEFVFLIVGDGPLFKSLSERVRRESLGNVRMLGERDDIPHLLSAADIFLLPSVFEGVPVATIEALASGLPVIASNTLTSPISYSAPQYHRASLNRIEDWTKLLTSISASISSENLTNRRLEYGETIAGSPLNACESAKICSDIYLSRLAKRRS